MRLESGYKPTAGNTKGVQIVLNVEKAIERLEELRKFITDFPENQLVPVCENEIKMLEKELENYGW